MKVGHWMEGIKSMLRNLSFTDYANSDATYN